MESTSKRALIVGQLVRQNEFRYFRNPARRSALDWTRQARASLVVFAPRSPDPTNFTWPKTLKVGEAARQAATAFGYVCGNPGLALLGVPSRTPAICSSSAAHSTITASFLRRGRSPALPVRFGGARLVSATECLPGGGASHFHTQPVICAPFNRLADKFGDVDGPHGDWGGPANWLSSGGTSEVKAHYLGDMIDVEVTCGSCRGDRFNANTLDVTVRGKTIDDILNMSIEEAVTFFREKPVVARRVEVLHTLGLGYLTLGQSATTLSGGEAPRVKIATEPGKLQQTNRTVYILDEPTTGLHLADVERLLALTRLVGAEHLVILIEHHLDVIKTADYVVDLGPEGGHASGRVLASGTPDELARNSESHTGRFLRGRPR